MRLVPRFSLLSFLLFSGLICVSVSHLRVNHENEDFKRQVKALQTDLGYINVDDPKKAYLWHLGAPEDLTWRFRIYLPPGKTYRWNLKYGPIGPDGVPRSGMSSTSDGPDSQFTLTISLREKAGGDRWTLTTSSPGRSSTTEIATDRFEWLLSEEGVSRYSPGNLRDPNGTKEIDPDARIELLSIRDGEEGLFVYLDPLTEEELSEMRRRRSARRSNRRQ